MKINPKLIKGLSNNYGESINIPLNTNYIAPNDGIVQYGGYGTTQITLEVNGTPFGKVCSGTSGWSVNNTALVNKGDIIYIRTAGGGSISEANTHNFKARVD